MVARLRTINSGLESPLRETAAMFRRLESSDDGAASVAAVEEEEAEVAGNFQGVGA